MRIAPTARVFSNLGVFRRLRHELTKSPGDLTEALNLARSCLAHSDGSGPKRASILFNMSLACRDRYRLAGAKGDLEDWVRYAREALTNAEAGSAVYRTMTNNLVSGLRETLGDDPDGILDKIIEVARRNAASTAGASACPDPGCVALSAALITRYRRRGKPQDLDEAIALLRRFRDHGDPADVERPGCLSNLGIALMMRYDVQWAEADLDEGLAACRLALDIARDQDPERPMYYSNFCLLALTRAGRSQRAGDDLRLAVSAGRAALAATSPNDPRRAGHASNLAVALMARLRGGDELSLDDLDEAIALCTEAAARGPAPDAVAAIETNIALAKVTHYRVSGSRPDLDDAVARCRAALAALPVGMPDRAITLVVLGMTLLDRNDAGDLEACMAASEEAARTASAPLAARLPAVEQWARAAEMRADWAIACTAYSEALRLLNKVAAGPLSRRDQEHALAGAAGLPSRAVAAHLQAGDVEGAVRSFEFAMNSFVADPNVAVGHAGAISAMPVSSRSAELFYEPSELPLAR